MVRTFAARRWRGLAAVAPVGALLALAPTVATGQLPVRPPVKAPVHVPDLPTPHGLPQPVQNTVGQTVSRVNQAKNTATGQSGGGGGGGGSTNPGSGGGGPPSGNGGGPNGPRTGGGPNSGGGNGNARARARARARAAARRKAAARRAAAAAAAAKGRGGKGAIGGAANKSGGGSSVLRPIRDVIKVIPGPIKILIGVLAVLAFAFFVRSFFAARRARRLERHREELLGDLGLLQKALLPDVPERIGPLEATVAYRPAEGPGAGGDFYDVFEMEGDRVAIIVGDVCGHGRQALAVTALMRYTLRAYLTAGGEPRMALQIAARALENEPHAELTTVVLAVYDGKEGTLTYACAGHEPPILLGAPAHKPVTVGSSPPVGAGMETGLRQTTVALPPGSMACFFTDGLVDARLGDGLLGRERVGDIARGLGPGARAETLLARIAEAADRAPDDMAACIVRARDDAPQSDAKRLEELELDGAPGDEERARAFVAACGMPSEAAESLLKKARATVAEFGAAVVRVRHEAGHAEVVPGELEVRLPAHGNGNGRPSSLGSIPRISA